MFQINSSPCALLSDHSYQSSAIRTKADRDTIDRRQLSIIRWLETDDNMAKLLAVDESLFEYKSQDEHNDGKRDTELINAAGYLFSYFTFFILKGHHNLGGDKISNPHKVRHHASERLMCLAC